MLFVGHPTFGNFAAYGTSSTSRLNFRIADLNETVYIGFSRSFLANGRPGNFGQFRYRIRRASDDAIVFGPHTINRNTQNLDTYQQAVVGPAVVGGTGGYPTDATSTFQPSQVGEYYVEFEQDRRSNPVYIGLWDITLADAGGEITGRIYSQNWAFRVPELDPQLPDCIFGAEMNAVFYSYTADGFVTEIDFTDAGFQPLSFNLAFNRTGPGDSGDLSVDRQSVPDINASLNAAEHLIFLEEPDAALFPNGTCGGANIAGPLQCQGQGSFCIPITANRPGQTDIVLDFNQNGVYDDGLDRILVFAFEDGAPLSTCVGWDGLRGDGTPAPDGATLDILLTFSQGIQHWSLYDAERMTNGFCVTPVRPICGSGGAARLYYDDINILEDPGTGGPKRRLEGCDCRTGDCRTWTNFVSNAAPNCAITDSKTTGYGDRSTLNTWWSPATNFTSSLDVPVSITRIDGPNDFCPGTPTELTLLWQTLNTINSIEWRAPDGTILSTGTQAAVIVNEPGVYTATLVDDQGCTSVSTHALNAVACTINPRVVGVVCDEAGTPTRPGDDIYFASIVVTSSNSPDFNYDGVSYAYGDTLVVGPFPIAGGDVSLDFTDNFYSCCSGGVTIMAPTACSNTCAIATANVVDTRCDNAGTPADPSDDTFTFDMIVDGRNVSNGGWTNGAGLSGQYGVMTTFGPFPIANGTVNATFTDVDDPNCVIVVTVQPPPTCSNDCDMLVTVTNVKCDDGGTPFDASDDTYWFDLSVMGVNTPSIAYDVDGSGAYLYGNTNTFGPYPIVGSDFTFELADLADASCTLQFTLPDPPSTCSDACDIRLVDMRMSCVGEEELHAEVLLRSSDPNATIWESSTGHEGNYDVFVSLGAMEQGGGSMPVTFTDVKRPFCSTNVVLRSPKLEASCPSAVSQVARPFSSQRFERALSSGGLDAPVSDEVCWLPEADLTGSGRRSTDMVSILRAGATEARAFSFYLLAAPGSNVRGALFNVSTDAPHGCGSLVNDGPVLNAGLLSASAPVLGGADVPAGMTVIQSFTATIRGDEPYTLMTTTLNASAGDTYQWVILSADAELLTIDAPRGGAPDVTHEETIVVMDLTSAEVFRYADVRGSERTFGLPTVDSLCGEPTFAFNDSTHSTCVRAQIIRSFDLILPDTVLKDVCRQEIDFRNLGLSDVIWPESGIIFACDAEFNTLANGNPDPSYSGMPYVYQGGAISVVGAETQGMLYVDYVDETLEENGQTVVLRTWTVGTECDGVEERHTQRFVVQNGGEAFFSCPLNDHYCPVVDENIMIWGMDPFTCTASVDIPAPELNNLCDTADWVFQTEVFLLQTNGDTTLVATLNDGDDREVAGLAAGDYLVRYSGTHPDETVEDQDCRIRVADLDNPTAVCKRTLGISVSGNGEFILLFGAVDQGSYDNCGIVERSLRRLGDSLWVPAVAYFCQDVGTLHTVQLRVVDAAGNENFCETSVTVRDNTLPYCTGLDDLVVTCSDLPDEFDAYDTLRLREAFGSPDVVDNCSATARELAPIVDGDNCSPNAITRRFRALDQNGNFSAGVFTQTITILPSTNYAIRFPADLTTDCVTYDDSLVIRGGGCDSITYEVTERIEPANDAACRIVVRDYVVTNWCEWDGISPPTVIGRDEDCRVGEGERVWVVRNALGTFVDTDSLADNALPAAGACGGNPEGYLRGIMANNGRFSYQQRIRIEDDTPPDFTIGMLDMICADTSFCRTPVTATISVSDACQMGEGQVAVAVDFDNNGNFEAMSGTVGTLTGSYPEYEFTIPLRIGEHRFEFRVTDDCGNTRTEERVFRVTDCYVPALRCVQNREYQLEGQLNPTDVDGDGELEEAFAVVEATDLGSCSFTDCSGNLIYSVNRVGEAADSTQSRIFLDCDDRYRVDLEVYVWDRAFNPFAVQPDGSLGGPNWRMCVVNVFVQDPTLACNDCQVDERLTINGFVNLLDGEPLEGAKVGLRNDEQSATTDRFGSYQLRGDTGESYELFVEMEDDDPRAGLSALDMVMLRRVIIGTDVMDGPLAALAGDLDRDGRITVTDLVALQALVLGRSELYPESGTWRFVDAEWNGEGLPPEVISLTDLTACSEGNDWVAIRLGDLNHSYAGPSGLTAGRPDGGRTTPNRPMSMAIDEVEIIEGEEAVIRLRPQEGVFIGGQFGLYWDTEQLEVVNVESDFLTATDYVLDEGRIWLAWADQVPAGDLVSVTVRAKATLRTSEALFTRGGTVFNNELYGPGLRAHDLYIDWTVPESGGPADNNVVLDEQQLPVYTLNSFPNPARFDTRIGIVTQELFEGQLRLHNEIGQTVYVQTVSLSPGENWVHVDLTDLPSGLYLAIFDNGTHRAVTKLVRQ